MRSGLYAAAAVFELGMAVLAPAQDRSTVLRVSRSVHQLSHEMAASHIPVHLRAVVTYFDPFIDKRHGALFVHDRSGSVFVRVPLDPPVQLRAGDKVEVTGTTDAGDYAPIVQPSAIRVIGRGDLPHPVKATVPQLLAGPLDGQWVEVTGVVQNVRMSARNVVLDVRTTEGPVSATSLIESGIDYRSLVDAVVAIDANAGPVFNTRRQMVGTHLFFPTALQVKVLERPTADPFRLPVQSLSSLLRFNPQAKFSRRVHLQGTVTLQWPGQLLCIQQAAEGLCMDSRQADAITAGDRVDVIGFPALSGYKATLEHAEYRKMAGAPTAVDVRWSNLEQMLSSESDGQLVSLDGRLIGWDWTHGNISLVLSAGSSIFSAVLPAASTVPENIPWTVGSTLRLRGVGNLQVDPISTSIHEGAVRQGSFQVLLGSRADVQVLKRPSWWTTRHMLGALAVAGLAAFVSFAWIVVLRHRVEKQTRALRESEERLRHMSYHDALTGLPNRALLNDRLEMEIHRADRFQSGVGLMMLDLDGFKVVNDRLGHRTGDRLLCALADRLQAAIRKTDTVARFGGDEFVVLLPDLTDETLAETVAVKIVTSVSTPVEIEGVAIPVTVSAGLCVYPSMALDAETLLRHADEAMYQAKAAGKNTYRMYDSRELAGQEA